MGPKPIPSDDEAKAHSFKTMPRIWTRVDTRQICETDSCRGKDAQARGEQRLPKPCEPQASQAVVAHVDPRQGAVTATCCMI